MGFYFQCFILAVILAIADSYPILDIKDEDMILRLTDHKYLVVRKLIEHTEHQRVARDISCSSSADCDSDESENLDTSETQYHYKPIVRIAGFHRSKHPLSNYADSYDEFPTVA